jgi:hypothetical protein
MASIEMSIAAPSDIDGILALQEENQLEHGGLLSARLPRAWFEAALNDLPVIVARRSERVVGYLVTASREATHNVPVIAAMRARIPGHWTLTFMAPYALLPMKEGMASPP